MALDHEQTAQFEGETDDNFTIIVAPGIDTINGPITVTDLAPHESVHIVVAAATEQDRVTARLAASGCDTEVIYRGEVVAILRNLTRLFPTQVVFAPLEIVADPIEPAEAAEKFIWNGQDRTSLRRKPVTVRDYVPGLDQLEANLGFGPYTPKVKVEASGDGDTFVRVNGKALFRLTGVSPHEVNRSDLVVNRI